MVWGGARSKDRAGSHNSARQTGGALHKNKQDFLPVLSLILIFTLATGIVDAHGNFPLNDDWSYAEATRGLVFQHDWRPSGWTSMTLITQSLWGAIACTILDCSFEHLRFSTIFAGLLLLLSSYILFRVLSAPSLLAFVATTIIVFNPVTFALTYTFMTDVLFELLLVVSSIFCVIALKRRSSIHIGFACVLITIATLCRQLALCLPIAFCISYLLVSAEPFDRRLAKSAAPLLISVVAFLVYDQWLRRTGRLPVEYGAQALDLISILRSPIRAFGRHIPYHLLVATVYLGFFCFPVTLCIGHSRFSIFQKPRRVPVVLASLVSVLIVVLLVVMRNVKPFLMPLSYNILNANGIGPLTLRDTYILGLNSVPGLPTGFWVLITCASVIGVWLFVYQNACILVGHGRLSRTATIPVSLGVFIFGFAGLVIYLSPLLVAGFFDRYIADIVPLACIMLVSQSSFSDKYAVSGSAGAFAICVGVVIFSVLTTHDYLSWNRARWQAIHDLEKSSVADATSLDGGFEYNGYRSYNPDYVAKPMKSWWWVDDDKYMITFAPLPGVKIVRRYDYKTYMPIATRFIYVLRRPD